MLAAMYVRQGTVSQTALAGLEKLLKDTDFYEGDLRGFPAPAHLTMLDLTVEAVCDRIDCCQVWKEKEWQSCVIVSLLILIPAQWYHR